MARARNIKPGFFKNEDLAEIEPVGRLLFIGLWTLADRNGVLEDRPKKIKLELLPYDAFDPDAMLQSLSERKLISRFKVGGVNLIHVTNFAKHQNPHHTEKDSGLPKPPEIHGEVTVSSPLDNGSVTVNPAFHNGENPADSLIPGFTDSLIKKQEEQTHTNVRAFKPARPTASDLTGRTSGRWQEFIDRYPLRVELNDAASQFVSVVTELNEAQVFACLDRYLLSDQVARGVVSKPAKWLLTQHRDKWIADWPKARDSPTGDRNQKRRDEVLALTKYLGGLNESAKSV